MRFVILLFTLFLFRSSENLFAQTKYFLSLNGSVEIPTAGSYKTGLGTDVTFGIRSKANQNAFTISVTTSRFEYQYYYFINEIVALRGGYQFFPAKNFYFNPTIGVQKAYTTGFSNPATLAWALGAGYLIPSSKKGNVNLFTKINGSTNNLAWISIGAGYQFQLGKKG